MRGNMANDLEQKMVETRFESLFKEWKEHKDKDRIGLHASEILQTPGSFCMRKIILEHFYKGDDDSGDDWSPQMRKLQYYFGGEALHEKWQHMFEIAGISHAIEAPMYSKEYGFWYTPDGILKTLNKKYVAEIKTKSKKSFGSTKSAPIAARRQVQLYMHLTGVPHGIILAQNRDNLDWKIWVLDYNPDLIREHIERLNKIREIKEEFVSSGFDESILPERKSDCISKGSKKAQRCDACNLCFKEHNERVLK